MEKFNYMEKNFKYIRLEDNFKEVFYSFDYIATQLTDNLLKNIDETKIITKFESTKKLFLIFIDVVSDGNSPIFIDYFMELELVEASKTATRGQLAEMILAKKLLKYYYNGNKQEVEFLIGHFGGNEIYQAFCPNGMDKTNWFFSR